MPRTRRRTCTIRLVAISETPEGVLITPSEMITRREIAELDELLKEQGTTFEGLIESGRDIRSAVLHERYGLPKEG